MAATPSNAHVVGVGVLVVTFAVLALAVPEQLPLNDHNSFVARSDCAWRWGCDSDPRWPGWSPPVFHVYHALLGIRPYRLGVTSRLSLGLTVLSLVLAAWFASALFSHFRRPRAGRNAALCTVAIFLCQPAAWRIAVADTFWPFTLCAFWAAGIACLGGLRTGSPAAWTAAALALSLCILRNVAYFSLLPIFLMAPLCWQRGGELPPLRVVAVAGVAGAILVGPYLASAIASTMTEAQQNPIAMRALADPIAAAASLWRGSLWLDPRFTPAALVVASAAAACVVFLVSDYRRMLLPVIFAYAATESLLSLAGDPNWVATAYPSRPLLGFPGLQFLSFLTACGLAWIGERHLRWRRQVFAILVLAIATSLPFSGEAFQLATQSRVLGRELVSLSRAFESIPEHDLLVIAPATLPRLAGSNESGDPVEAFFPIGEYRYVLEQRGLRRAPVIFADDFVRQVESGRFVLGERKVLFYLGSTLHSFLRDEITAGAVPENLERPLLMQMRQQFAFDPVHQFTIDTEQHPGIAMRLAADRRPTDTLGYYPLCQ